MKNAFQFATYGAAFALSAVMPAQAQAQAIDAYPPVELDHLHLASVQLFAPGELDLPRDPAVDAFLADLSGNEAEPSAQVQLISDADLDTNRGGQTLVVGNQTLKSIVANNTIVGDVISGSVNVTDNAFSNFSGLGNVAINTGAQVSLQTGVNVIINLSQ